MGSYMERGTAVGRIVCDALDSLLAQHGFSAGQVGANPDGFGVLFHIDYDEFRSRFAYLPPAGLQQPGRGCCVDLHVDGVVAPDPRIGAVYLETFELGEMLDQLGIDQPIGSAGLAELPLDTALVTLRNSLAALFTAH
jgi:hypothetical protein